MPVVDSADGTPIAYGESGQGPPLVLVHGTTSEQQRWSPLLAALEQRFRVYRIDRRGRGGSGDAPDGYALEREVEDLAALIARIDAPAHLLGHSFGGLVALETALRVPTGALRSLVAYEPPIQPTGAPPPTALLDTMDALVARGEREAAVRAFFHDLLRVPADDLALLEALPTWRLRVSAAHTIARELRAAFAYRIDPAHLGALATPTLLLVGEHSPARFQDASRALAAALPRAHIEVLAGAQHSAMDTERELFLRTICSFFDRI